jgi:hypothetical protein
MVDGAITADFRHILLGIWQIGAISDSFVCHYRF